MKTAIIGGTGFYRLPTDPRHLEISTPFGKVKVTSQSTPHNQKEIFFLPRHGTEHGTPPHQINYRANLWALKKLGVTHVFATNAVGSLNPDFQPGKLIIFSDFIDFTKNRAFTFFDGKEGVIHASMGEPYCSELKRLLKKQANASDITFAGEGIYIGVEGPRFETAAEIRMYQQWGADVVGMTGVPEVNLAKELGLCYIGIGIITNWGTGIAHDHQLDEIMAAVAKNRVALTSFFTNIIDTETLSQENCHCKNSQIKI